MREFFVIFAPMGKYVYIVDYNKGDVFDYEGVFSTHKKADDYVDDVAIALKYYCKILPQTIINEQIKCLEKNY